MPRRLLVIDGDDHKRFFLSMLDGTLTVGTDQANPEIALRDLRALRIHCEVEVEGEAVVAIRQRVALGAATRQEIHAGEAMHVGHSHIKLAPVPQVPAEPAETESAEPDATEFDNLALAETESRQAATPAAPPAAVTQILSRRLLVIDGADQGRSFPLNVAGRITIGKSGKHADIVLHDLYVSRVHCELQVDDTSVRVTHIEGDGGTLVNNQKIDEQELRLGDVLRVGNSHLRFELDSGKPSMATVVEVETVEVESEEDTELVAPISSPVDALAELENQVLGHFELGAVLGRGLSGMVFHGHLKDSDEPIAVKVLATAFPASDAEQQAFIRAIKVVAPMRHPHLVGVHRVGKSGQYCWIARDYVEGESLAALIDRLKAEDRLGWKRACRVAVHLARLLQFLHQKQVRGIRITPTNVLVETDTKATKLANLMVDGALAGSDLAHLIAEDRLTAELPYRAPEQTDPAAAVDLRTSLYALGAVLYALMAGQPPFTGKTHDEIIKQIREAKLVKPSKFLPEMPAAFETAVLKLLARKPEDRYQSADELLAVIEPLAKQHDIKV